MDDALVVGLFERLRDLQCERKAFSKGKRPRFEAFGERRAVDELHDEGFDAAALLEPEDRGDVGVMELRQKLRLALESRQALLVLGELGWQDLDRHLAIEPGVGRAIDLAHAALAELGGDLVGAEPLPGHRWTDHRTVLQRALPSASRRSSSGNQSRTTCRRPESGVRREEDEAAVAA